jgi:hypothetical protein
VAAAAEGLAAEGLAAVFAAGFAPSQRVLGAAGTFSVPVRCEGVERR